MGDALDRRNVLIIGLILGAIVGLSGIGAAHTGTSFRPVDGADVTEAREMPDRPSVQGAPFIAELAEHEEGDGEEEGREEEENGEGENEGASLLGDWWGLGGEATETPYIGLVELGVVVLGIGLGGYALGKRTSLLPPQSRRYLLPAHEWTMLIGTGLTVPHFLTVEEWGGLGFVVGVLLGIEVLSGLYGRHLHRHVVRLGRGAEPAPLVGRLIRISKETLFSRWRRIHISLTIVTGLVLFLHIVTALGA